MRKKRDARLRAISNVLASSPGLGAFTAAVALLGLDGAVAVCESREPSSELCTLWEGLGYTLAQLPSGADISCLLVGIEAKRRQYIRVKVSKKEPLPLFVLAEDLKSSAKDIHRGMQLLKDYGGSIHAARTPTGTIGAI